MIRAASAEATDRRTWTAILNTVFPKEQSVAQAVQLGNGK
jgi:hypothetical protein